MTPVKTSRGFLEQLASHVQPFRPDSRLKNNIVIDAPFSMLMDDLMSMLTFELKPKWGFKPSSTHPKKRLYCRYCMHSHMKQIPIHDYCPLDLYSGDQARIQKALVSLFTAPLEKTLRTYVNNSPVCLEQAMFEEIRMQDILEHILVQDPILSRLKSLQSRLDALDVESILPLYQQYQSSIFHTTDIAVWQIVVKRFFNRQPLLEKEQSLQKIYEYVLSMTFKDCSIMINVNKTTEKDKRTVDVNGSLFSYDVKVIDTDLKNLEKIPYWHQLDQAIVQHAVDTCFEKQECK
ncbi:inositol-pentakisphosphate 2-kinase [Gilbertella persicaria]|uniref:inositol-pentakisphosphate 2-kinase n=1 Tax=Gilbertella persicaria TaxID=101096 RepID=UPI00221EB025|nr:inositol-pentakisphosphate 2-kinase [Gilbertella persicaria]KAI8097913.1 inositol-pentakisphosphate 2-kinase [Gilbertella persicaria]